MFKAGPSTNQPSQPSAAMRALLHIAAVPADLLPAVRVPAVPARHSAVHVHCISVVA